MNDVEVLRNNRAELFQGILSTIWNSDTDNPVDNLILCTLHLGLEKAGLLNDFNRVLTAYNNIVNEYDDPEGIDNIGRYRQE